MNKIKSILAIGLLSVAGLASCGEEPEDPVEPEKPYTWVVKNIEGGTEEEQKAINECVTKKSIAQISSASTMVYGSSYDLLEDNGDYLLLATSQGGIKIKGSTEVYTVTIEWEIDNTSAYYGDFVANDATHKIFSVNYPGYGGTEGSLDVKIAKMTCGDAVTTNPEVNYKCNIKGASYKHDDMKISDLNKVVAGPFEIKNKDGKVIQTLNYGYDLVDYSLLNPYFKTNNPGSEKEYYYINVKGKMIYSSPDGNWGLLADGEDVLEVYSGSAANISPKYYPALANEYVEVVGNMGMYMGNIQTGFVTRINKAEKEDVTEPTMVYDKIDADAVKYITEEFDGKDKDGNPTKIYGHKQCVPGVNLSNALKQLTGTYVPGSLQKKDDNGNLTDVSPSNINSSGRFVFKMKLAASATAPETEVTIAYDYHTDKEGSVGLFNAIKALVSEVSPTAHTIKGTLRYNCSDSSPFVQNDTNPGHWELVPFLADHVVAA